MMQCPRWFNGPNSSGQQYKIYSLFNRSCDCHSESSTVPAEDLCFGVCVCVMCNFMCVCEWPSVAEQSSCRSTGSKLYLSFSPSSCLPSANLLFTARLSLTSPLSYLFGLSVSVWFSPCLGHPSSPSLPACLHRVSGHASYLLTLTGLG